MKAGTIIAGRYVATRPIADGGMGSVWLVHDTQTGLERALKIVVGSQIGRDDFRARLGHEGQVLFRLSHPNLVKVTDYGLSPDGPFLVMEYIRGRPLTALEWIIPRTTSVRVVRTLLSVAKYLHAKRVIHRDIKASNVLLEVGADGNSYDVKLVDLGIAGDTNREPLPGPVDQAGTPAYMDPAGDGGGAADVFGCATLVFKLVFGRFPIPTQAGETVADYLARKRSQTVEVPAVDRHGARVPQSFRRILARALDLEVSRRFDLDGLAAALAPWEHEVTWLPDHRRSRRSLALAAIGSSILGGSGVALASGQWLGTAREQPVEINFCGSSTVGQRLVPALVGRYLGVDVGDLAQGIPEEGWCVNGARHGRNVHACVRWSASGAAFDGLEAGTCDVGMSSRPAKASEAGGLQETVLGLDAIMVLASADSPVQELSIADLRAVYETGSLSGHTVFAREAESGTFGSLKDLLGLKTLSSNLTAGAGAMLERIAVEHPALGFASAQELVGRTDDVRIVPIRTDTSTRAHYPSPRAIVRSQYPLVRGLHLYRHADESEAMVLDFVEFARSPDTVPVFDAFNMVHPQERTEESTTFSLRDCAAPSQVLTWSGVRVGTFQYPKGKFEASLFEQSTFAEIRAEAMAEDRSLVAVGYSSDDGDPLNCRLSDERARRVQAELGGDSVAVVAGGPTAEWGDDPAQNQIVVVYAVD